MTKGELKKLIKPILEESLREIMLEGGYLLEIIKYVNRNNVNKLTESKNNISTTKKRQYIIEPEYDNDDDYSSVAIPKTNTAADKMLQQQLNRYSEQLIQGGDPELMPGSVPMDTIAAMINNKYYNMNEEPSEDEEW